MIDRKAGPELSKFPFDGNIVNWLDWRTLVRNQLLSVNQGYGRVIFETEREKSPLTFARLATCNLPGLNVDLSWISRALYTFMSSNMTKEFNRGLMAYVGGEELNGLELWRRLYWKNQGGSRKVEVGEMRALHKFPKCTDPSQLLAYLGQFQNLLASRGSGLPREHKAIMLEEMLPERVAKDVRDRVGNTDPDAMLAYIYQDLDRWSDERAAGPRGTEAFHVGHQEAYEHA